MNRLFYIISIVAIIIILFALTRVFGIGYREKDIGIFATKGSRGDAPIEYFTAPLDYGMGKYSNIKLKWGGEEYWRQVPEQPYMDLEQIYVPQGTPLPLYPTRSLPISSSNGPSVDGTDKMPNDMFMFAYNKCLPECCPATHSCSGGCICNSPKQDDFINTRGNNRSAPTEY